jgi:hypothetical protein
MKKFDRLARKSYAMHRMALALDRAIALRTGAQKERAARWAAAWGLLCGIQTQGVRLRHNDIEDVLSERIEGTGEPSDSCEDLTLSAMLGTKQPTTSPSIGVTVPSESAAQETSTDWQTT